MEIIVRNMYNSAAPTTRIENVERIDNSKDYKAFTVVISDINKITYSRADGMTYDIIMDEDTEREWVCKSPEWNSYLAALEKLSVPYIASIRRKFAVRAYRMFKNEAVRRLVIEYGKEHDSNKATRRCEFFAMARDPMRNDSNLEGDSCINNASAYADAIKFMFGI